MEKQEDNALLGALTRHVLAASESGYSDEMFCACRAALRIARRRLNVRSPRFVGVEHERWSDAAYEDLTHEFYADRLVATWGQLVVRAQTEGIGPGFLVQMAKHFLEDCRRRLDPHGTAIHRKLASLVQEAVESGDITTVPLVRPPTRDTTLRIQRLSPGLVATVQGLVDALDRHPRRPELLERLQSLGTIATEETRTLWSHLASCGIQELRFGDLAEAVEQLVARREERLDLDEIPHGSGTMEPDETHVVVDALRSRIAKSRLSEVRRERLLRLVDLSLECLHAGEHDLSSAEIARRMNIPKQRLGELRKQLLEIGGPTCSQFFLLGPDDPGNRPSDPP